MTHTARPKPTTMTLVAIRKYARQLMDDHGFSDVPFRWDAASRRAGAVWYDRRTRAVTHLSLSRQVIPQFTDAQITDTILHEIAHLIAGPHVQHGASWRAACVAIGAQPVPCYSESAFRAANEPSRFAN